MTIPYREFLLFHKTTFEGYDITGAYSWNAAAKWTTVHYNVCMIGNGKQAGGIGERWDPVFIPSDSSFIRPSGMDEPCAFKVIINLGAPELNDPNLTDFDLIDGILKDPPSPDIWNLNLCSGRYYDGSTPFPAGYPHDSHVKGLNYTTVTITDLPKSYELWFPPGPANTLRDELFRLGYIIYASNWNPNYPAAWGAGDRFRVSVVPEFIHIQYLNCVVNSITPMYCGTAAGTTIIFSGLGFDNSNADIGGGWPWGGACDDRVDMIYFDGLQGQGTYTYNRTAGVPVVGQFRINSNSEIELVMRAMAKGSYAIRMYKQNVQVGAQPRTFHITDYAGDWRSDEDGRAHQVGEEGRTRFEFLVSDEYVPEGDSEKHVSPVVLTNWTFENKAGEEAVKNISDLDTCAPSRFYEGWIKSHSGFKRAIDDRTGMPLTTDMNIELVNDIFTQEITKLMTQYLLKNRFVELFLSWGHWPEGWKTSFLKMIVDDHADMGPTWSFSLKDISKKFFKVKLPRYIITGDEYPNAHENALGQPIPEVLGLNSLTGVEKGAVKAHCTDTTTFEYVLAASSLHSIPQVYSGGVLMATPADYSIVYKDGGRTYIDFVLTQGDNEVTANCAGYMFAPWNSANGYVQNPAYIIAFLLALLTKVPIERLNMPSIDELATAFDDRGYGEIGKFIIQNFDDVEAILTKLLFTFGIKFWPDLYGRFKVGKKTVSNFTSDLMIFDQIDSMQHATRSPNQREAFNYIKAQWDYYPNAGIYKGSAEQKRDCAIKDFKDQEIEPPESPMTFPWTTSEAFVVERIMEELLKHGYGDPKIEFSLPLVYATELDVFDNFMYQDEFGPSKTGEGEERHYYYVESINYDIANNKIDVVGVDLNYLLRQCMIVAPCDEIAFKWEDATEWMRAFAYVGSCALNGFSDGEPLKMVCKCES